MPLKMSRKEVTKGAVCLFNKHFMFKFREAHRLPSVQGKVVKYFNTLIKCRLPCQVFII